MGRMKDLFIKLQEGLPLTEAEKNYVKYLKDKDGQKEDYLYQEALRDIEKLNEIDPPDEDDPNDR